MKLMLAPLEYMARPVVLAAGELTFADSTVRVPAGALVLVCAWNEGHRAAAMRLLENGYHVSHGLCTACAAEITAVNPKLRPVYAN